LASHSRLDPSGLNQELVILLLNFTDREIGLSRTRWLDLDSLFDDLSSRRFRKQRGELISVSLSHCIQKHANDFFWICWYDYVGFGQSIGASLSRCSILQCWWSIRRILVTTSAPDEQGGQKGRSKE
jgi:hypothetical protein